MLDGELFVAIGDKLEFEILQERIHPAKSRIDMLAEKTPASFVAFDLLALGDDVVRRPPVRRAPRGAGGRARRPRRPLLPHPHHHRPGGGRGLVPPVRGRRPGRRGRQAAGGDVPAERPHHAEDQARAHRRRGRGRATASTRPRPPSARCSARSCSACTPTGSCSTSASRASFTEKRRAELIEELQPLVVPIEEHPWGEWQEWAIANPDRVPGHPEPVERRQGPLVHAAAAGAGARGRLRPHGGPPVPAHRAVPAVASRPRPRIVRLRAVGGAGQLRPR